MTSLHPLLQNGKRNKSLMQCCKILILIRFLFMLSNRLCQFLRRNYIFSTRMWWTIPVLLFICNSIFVIVKSALERSARTVLYEQNNWINLMDVLINREWHFISFSCWRWKRSRVITTAHNGCVECVCA